jgi:hypothetical protein
MDGPVGRLTMALAVVESMLPTCICLPRIVFGARE